MICVTTRGKGGGISQAGQVQNKDLSNRRFSRTPTEERRKSKGEREKRIQVATLLLLSLLGVLVVGHGGAGRLLAATADGAVGEVDAEQRHDLELLRGRNECQLEQTLFPREPDVFLSLPLASTSAEGGGSKRSNTHSRKGLAKQLEQVDLVRVERVAFLADGMRRRQCRDTLEQRSRHAELAELRLEGMRCGVIVDHDRACMTEHVRVS